MHLHVARGLDADPDDVAAPVALGATRNIRIRAAAAGTVIRVVCNVSKGSCDVDGKPTLSGCGWYVEVRHEGDVVTRYCNLVRRPAVTAGQTVASGAILGYVGRRARRPIRTCAWRCTRVRRRAGRTRSALSRSSRPMG